MTPRPLEAVDVVVVGWGVAGASAAIEALDAGLSVAILDRFSGGGASQKSGGVVYAGGGTRHQKTAGYTDSPEAMFEYLRHEVGGVVSDETLRQFCLESVSNLEWLESLGAPYSHEVPPGGKTSYPSDGYYLYFSGNELVPECRGDSPAAPRGHRTVGRGHGGVVLYAALRQACIQKGARIYTQTRMTGLIQADSGAVIGAHAHQIPAGSAQALEHARLATRCEAVNNTRPRLASKLRRQAEAIEQRHAEPVEIRARRGVVLSTGGFIFNRGIPFMNKVVLYEDVKTYKLLHPNHVVTIHTKSDVFLIADNSVERVVAILDQHNIQGDLGRDDYANLITNFRKFIIVVVTFTLAMFVLKKLGFFFR
ncbi:MAG: FAD-dependent oxidoreductase [Betaproteobacteria bacterium]|nr:FAD-dependent oxidoreductase [Betaproteobacteria bacterium]